MNNNSIFSDNNEINSDAQILYSGSISAISRNISGENLDFGDNTIYSKNDDVNSSIVFNVSDISRLIDIEEELRQYEVKYVMPSSEFYSKWKSDPSFDKTDFNKWADLYRSLQYVQK